MSGSRGSPPPTAGSSSWASANATDERATNQCAVAGPAAARTTRPHSAGRSVSSGHHGVEPEACRLFRTWPNRPTEEGPAIGDSAVFLFVGLVLFLLAGISERRRRSLGEAASPFQARAPLVIGLCGLIDVVLAILLRLA